MELECCLGEDNHHFVNSFFKLNDRDHLNTSLENKNH